MASATTAEADVHQPRETISRVVAGCPWPKLGAEAAGYTHHGDTSQVGPIRLEENYTAYDLDLIETNRSAAPTRRRQKKWKNSSSR